LVVLCVIGAAAAVRRIVVLIAPPAVERVAQMAALDLDFASHKALTLWHIVPALSFVVLLPLWFMLRIRERPEVHRRVTYALFVLGGVVGVTALLLSLHPVGGVNEAAATLVYDSLFLFSLGRAWVMLRRGDFALHRTWMMRAIAVLLGIATTRPVMGVFFATEPVTHLGPQQFFGTAFWIGFTVTYIAGEAYLRSYPDMEMLAASEGSELGSAMRVLKK
jgi:uncharacterized membrane protein YozB (DUF420 family)